MICRSCNGTGIAHMPDISGENDDWLDEAYSAGNTICGTCDGTGYLSDDADAGNIPGMPVERVVGEVIATDPAHKRITVRLQLNVQSGQRYWFTGMESIPFQPGVMWVYGAMTSLARAGNDVEMEVHYLPLPGAHLMQRTSG